MSGFQPVDISAFSNAQNAAQTARMNEQTLDLRSQLAPYQVQEAESKSILDQYAIKGAQQEQELRDTTMASSAIAQAAAQASTAPDPETAWDANFKALQAKGNAQAGQFVGRYSPILASRVSGLYADDAGAASGPTRAKAAAAANIDGNGGMDFDRAFAGVPPTQIPQILERTGQMMDALSKVRNADDWEAMKKAEVAAGYAQAGSLGAYSPLTIPKLYNHLLGQFQYLQNRAADQATGAPAPLVQGKTADVGGQLYAVNDRTETGMPTVTPLTPNPKAAELAAQNPFASAGAAGTMQPGTVSLAGAAQRIQTAENATGNPAAKNPLSSATGNGQFINSTWLKTAKAELPQVVKGMSDQQILDLRKDPQIADQMTQALARDNGMELSKQGHPVTTATLTLAHRFGVDGADKMLNATPETPMEDVVSKKVLDANPDIKGQTVGSYVQRVYQKVGNDPVQGITSSASDLVGSNVHGKDFIKSLDGATGAEVQALLDGRMQFPSSFAASKPYWQQMYRLVAQADPNFDMVDYNARAGTRKDFATGKASQNITSFNTAIGHLDQLDKSVDELHNSNFPDWNKLANAAAVRGGDTRYQSALKDFQTAKNAVVDELTRAFRGSGGNVHDIESWEETLNEADSPSALHTAVKKAVGLLQSRVESLGDQYNRGMGTTREPMTLLAPHAVSAIERLTGEPAKQPATRTADGTIKVPGGAAVPSAAAAYLKQNPNLKAQFDAKYGAGAAEKVLGNG